MIAMVVKGPGDVEVTGSVMNFYIGDEIVSMDTTSKQFDTMGKVCSSIQFNPLIGLASGLTHKSHEHVEPLSEFENHQSYLVAAMSYDPSNLFLDMPRTSCDIEEGLILEMR